MSDPPYTRRAFLAAGFGASCAAGGALAQARRRVHTATEAAPLDLVASTRRVNGNRVSIVVQGAERVVVSNGIPDHPVGSFPNSGNPNRISAQSHRFEMPAYPRQAGRMTEARGLKSGVAVNGVPFDPGAAEFWQGDPSSGWQYEALGGAVALGLDGNYGHVQPTGAYHYHGLPVGLMQGLGWSMRRPSPLIGFAADGFPIYALTAEIDGRVVEMTSSWRLKRGAPGRVGARRQP